MARGGTSSFTTMRSSGKGPKNFGRLGTGLKAKVPPRRANRAATPQASAARASAGYTPSNGGGSGVPRATSPMASAPRTSNPAKNRRMGSINLSPRADGVSRI